MVTIHENDSVAVVRPQPRSVVVVDPPPSRAVVVRATGSPIVVPGPTERIVTVTERATVLAIASPAQGPAGPPGPPGSAPTGYPVTAASSWSYTHNLAWMPEVRLVDADGFAADVGVEYPDPHQVYLEFPTPFTGTIYLA